MINVYDCKKCKNTLKKLNVDTLSSNWNTNAYEYFGKVQKIRGSIRNQKKEDKDFIKRCNQCYMNSGIGIFDK